MGNKHADKQGHDQNEGDVFHSSRKSGKLKGSGALYISEFKTWTLLKGAKPRTLVVSLMPSETGESCFQALFQSRGLGIRVLKHLVSLDEKYLRRCLELMHISASKGAPCALSVNLNSSDMGLMPEYVTVARRNTYEGTKYAIDYPMAVGTGDLDLSPVGEGIVGSVMGSSSMMSILSSPLFQRPGILDHEAKLGGTSLFENKRCMPSYYQGSPGQLTLSPSPKPGRKNLAFRNQEHRSDSVQQSPISRSSGLSVTSDQSSASSFSQSDSQGMLQCIWEGGVPHFTFSVDDQKELYLANAWKVNVANEKGLDFVYFFHSKRSGRRMFDFADNASDLIGKMKVSTSFSLCPNNSKVVETEFVMVGANANHAVEMHASTQNNRRSQKLSKIMELFKSGHPSKQRTPSLFGGTSAIPEDFSAEKGLAVCNSPNRQGNADRAKIDSAPNLEIAAVVVKDHIQLQQNEKEVGGWGLKFLKRTEIKQNTISSDVSAPSECCPRSANNCSTSMDIIVPAGYHGGPNTRDSRPSSLTERWRLGGRCDCGGWDIGCPLKVLEARPRGDGWPSSESQRNCKSFDVLIKGSKEGRRALKMVNIHEGLYFISFQSASLSPLQCFSIAVAIIHSQSPSLRPKHVHV